ncbi:hypothetical protein, partial [Ralstonia solanacearum]|uniref:hypothetical protein n=1 Tax=Ralstonia solanacearum TaxID=305 RepID=UPI00202A6991
LAPESASAAKAAILSQVGQVYFGGWASFTSALTSMESMPEKKEISVSIIDSRHQGNLKGR